MHLAPDVFVLPGTGDDSRIAFAPLVGIVAQINVPMADLIGRIRLGPAGPGIGERGDAARQLLGLGLVSATPYPALAPDSRDQPFVPTSVTLLLTSRCNLGCTYCYATRGRDVALARLREHDPEDTMLWRPPRLR